MYASVLITIYKPLFWRIERDKQAQTNIISDIQVSTDNKNNPMRTCFPVMSICPTFFHGMYHIPISQRSATFFLNHIFNNLDVTIHWKALSPPLYGLRYDRYSVKH